MNRICLCAFSYLITTFHLVSSHQQRGGKLFRKQDKPATVWRQIKDLRSNAWRVSTLNLTIMDSEYIKPHDYGQWVH